MHLTGGPSRADEPPFFVGCAGGSSHPGRRHILTHRKGCGLTRMSAVDSASTMGHGETRGRAKGAARDLVELSKPGITRLVVITSAVGFGVAYAATEPAARPGGFDLVRLLLAGLIGTALCSSGANALNMWMERRRDALMRRTAGRPIPSGRMSHGKALAAGVAFGVVGVAVLGVFANPVSAVVAVATILTYLLWYTPLKPLSSLSTLVGTIPGALPPLIGWTAASPAGPDGLHALLDPGGWSIVALMVVWQVPHFLALAWMYREDYARGGHRVLPVLDGGGSTTVRATLTWTLALLPVSLAPLLAMPHVVGLVYAIAAVALWGLFLRAAVRLAREATEPNARKVFIASVIYLPLVLGALALNAALSVLA